MHSGLFAGCILHKIQIIFRGDDLVKKTALKNPYLALALIFMVAVLQQVSVFAAPAPSSIELKVSAGFDESAKVGASAPFKISVTNTGDNVDGELQVISNVNPNSRTVLALPVSLPSGASKDISITVPIYTADKKFTVRFAKGDKVLKEENYQFIKLFSPQNPTIGILADDQESFRVLNGMKLSENTDPQLAAEIKMKAAVMTAAGEKMAFADRPVELIGLNKNNMPDDIKVLNTFDVIIISNFDTSLFTDKQRSTLEQWVAQGKALFLCTGPNYKKVYGGLSEALKPFSPTGSTSLSSPQSLGAFIEKPAPSGKVPVVTGNAGSGKVTINEKGTPLATVYKYGNGFVSLLAFDPSLEPLVSWDNLQMFWQKLITESSKAASELKATKTDTFYQSSSGTMPGYQHLASNVPESQTPPFDFLLVMIGIYIVLVGPAIYLFLKRKDKRDWSWVVIPAVAILFMGITYVAGFKTRYTTAVLNNFSLIELNPERQDSQIYTYMGVFNNERGNMSIEYDKTLNIDANSPQNYYDDRYYPNMQNENARITSKLTLSDKAKYELYDVYMWTPKYMTASKSVPTSGKVIEDFSITDGTLKATVKNNTSMAFREAFISVGNNFIEVGDLLPGEEKKIDTALSSPSVKKRYDDFIDARYGPSYIAPGAKMPPNWKTDNRKRNMLDNVFRNIYMPSVGEAKITFLALNYDDPGYTVSVNGAEPKIYNTNVLYSVSNLDLVKGSRLDIPTGIIRPALGEDTKNAFFDDPLNGGVRVNMDGDVDFFFTVPANIAVENFKLHWSSFMPMYIKYQPKPPKGASQQTYAQNTYKYFIYNNVTSKWEEAGAEYDAKGNVSQYLNDKKEIKVRANVTIDRSGMEGELLGVPELEISGVVK